MDSRHWRRGVVGTSVIVLAAVGSLALAAWWRYEGMCGSPFPFLAAPYPCSRGEYVRQSLYFTFRLFESELWWAVPGVLLAGTGVAWLIVRLRSRP